MSLKSKGVNVNNITEGIAILSFSSVVQTHEHFQSRGHKEAIELVETNNRKDKKNKYVFKPPRKVPLN